jgi:hypothetical protein
VLVIVEVVIVVFVFVQQTFWSYVLKMDAINVQACSYVRSRISRNEVPGTSGTFAKTTVQVVILYELKK